jgi:hypothetical protein
MHQEQIPTSTFLAQKEREGRLRECREVRREGEREEMKEERKKGEKEEEEEKKE